MYNWSRGNSSRKLFEYMASGKPIISTVSMNYSPIEKYRCGISMGSGSAEELAACIRKIKGMGNEERERMGRNARAGAEDFDAPVLTAKLADVIGYAQREWERKKGKKGRKGGEGRKEMKKRKKMKKQKEMKER